MIMRFRLLSVAVLTLSLLMAIPLLHAQGYSLTGALSKTITLTAAALAPSSHVDYVLSTVTLTPATTATAANGLNAMRGELDLTAGKTFGTGGPDFFGGVYGRVNFNSATVNIGSGDLAAVEGKFDLGTATLTSGHIAPLQSNIVNPPASALTTVDLVYAESAGGNPINSFFKAFGKSTYVFDFNSNVNPQVSSSCTPSAVTGATGGLMVNANGTTRWIPLAATCS